MARLKPLEAKLLALPLLGILVVLTAAGALLGLGLERLQREEARSAFAAARHSLAQDLQSRQQQLARTAERLAGDGELMAGLALLQRGTHDADGTRRHLAVELERLVGAAEGLALVLLDGDGRWTAYARLVPGREGGSLAGYLSGAPGGAPQARLLDGPAAGQAALPPEVAALAAQGPQLSSRQTLLGTADGPLLLAAAPLQQPSSGGPPRVLGHLLLGQTLGPDFFTRTTPSGLLGLGLFSPGESATGPLAELRPLLDLSRAMPLQAAMDNGEGAAGGGWQETPGYFLQLLSLSPSPPLAGEGIYAVLALEKRGVPGLPWGLGGLLLALLAAFLLLSLGRRLARRSISRPLGELLRQVEEIRAGRYAMGPGEPGEAQARLPEGGEFSPLFAALQEMAAGIRSREEQQRLWGSVLEQSRDAVFITDADNRILLVNRAFSAATGYAPEEVLGRTPEFLRSGRHDAEFYARLWRSLEESGHWQGELWDRAKDGRIHPQWAAISAVKDGQARVSHYIAIFSDLTEHKAAQDRILFLAQHDPLTELPNRALLQDRLTMAIAVAAREGHEVGVLLIDLDRFKTINDSLGHTVGDELIKGVTRRLQEAVRESDTVSRLGGDEFIVVLHRIRRSEDAAHVADGVLAQLAQPFSVAGKELRITASIGIGIFPADGEDQETLIKNADTAMFHAKERGRNNYQFFRREMNARAGERLALENALRGAVARREFELFYQPQVEIRSGRLIGAEALIRWRREGGEGGGYVPPAEFIPLAEETGSILEIGDWVLREACRQQQDWAGRWPALGLKPIPVAVNLSALQFRQSRFKENLLDILGDYDLPSGRIELELTESIVMEAPEAAGQLLAELKQAGLRLSIDDFGTGYSSLSYLKRFPLDKLKIDASFVRDIVNDSADLAIVHAVVSMGHSLGLRVVAEGVEHEAELLILNAMGCDIAQGFHFCRPLPAEQFQSWVAAYVPKRIHLGVPPTEAAA